MKKYVSRDELFTRKVWKQVMKLLNMKLNIYTEFYHEKYIHNEREIKFLE